MRELAKNTLLGACAIFTIAMALWSAVGLAFAGPEYGLVVTLSLLGACLLLAALQSLWFTDRWIRSLAYPGRLLGFGLCAFAALAACALAGRWFPEDNPGAWLSFTLVYLAVLGIVTACYAIRYRRDSQDLAEALSRYRQNRR